MWWKCCTQYASKCGKLSSGHRTGKNVFIPIPRKAMPKNAQTTAELHSSHTLVNLRSKFSKLGFNSTWTVNFQMFKQVLEKAEEQEIILPTSIKSLKSERVPEKHLFLLYWPCQSLWLCGSQQTVENSWRQWIPDHLTCFLRNMYSGQESMVRTGHGTTDWFQIRKGE